MKFSRPEYWSGWPFLSPGDLPNSGIEPRSPALWVDSLPGEPQGKPKNTEVGSLCLLHRIFPTQELNQGFLQLQADSLPTKLSGKSHIYTHIYGYIRRRQWHPTPVLLPGKSHGRRSLVVCSPWGR